MSGRVPVYVITGWLGAGKTTLLNQLLALRAARGRTGKIALVVNELGAIGVDAALLPADAARQIELPGGCVCCALGPELEATLHELLDAQPQLDACVLETTGVAEPLPIAWALEGEALAARVRLGAIVTVVDAEALPSMRAVSPAVDAQLRHADVLVLSKGDVATPDARAATLALARQLAPAAPILERGHAEAARWLDDVMADPALAPVAGPRLAIQPPLPHGMVAVACAVEEVVDLEELEDQLAALPGDVVRIKGLVRAVDGRRGATGPAWAAVHRVGRRVSSEPVAAPSPPHGRLVAIGHAPDAAALAAAVAAGVLPSGARGS